MYCMVISRVLLGQEDIMDPSEIRYDQHEPGVLIALSVILMAEHIGNASSQETHGGERKEARRGGLALL